MIANSACILIGKCRVFGEVERMVGEVSTKLLSRCVCDYSLVENLWLIFQA